MKLPLVSSHETTCLKHVIPLNIHTNAFLWNGNCRPTKNKNVEKKKIATNNVSIFKLWNMLKAKQITICGIYVESTLRPPFGHNEWMDMKKNRHNLCTLSHSKGFNFIMKLLFFSIASLFTLILNERRNVDCEGFDPNWMWANFNGNKNTGCKQFERSKILVSKSVDFSKIHCRPVELPYTF